MVRTYVDVDHGRREAKYAHAREEGEHRLVRTYVWSSAQARTSRRSLRRRRRLDVYALARIQYRLARARLDLSRLPH